MPGSNLCRQEIYGRCNEEDNEEAAEGYLKVLSRNSPGTPEKYHEKRLSEP